MNKVICDVCGTKYPETAEQCPICGCAKPENARVVSAEAIGAEINSTGSYTYVKGGRFSKSNVRKRNKAAASAREEQQPELPAEQETSAEKTNNKGLVIAIVALLLAIIAVMLFIFIRYFKPADSTGETTAAVQTTTSEATTETTELILSCTGIELSSAMVSFETLGDSWLLNAQVTPENTTDVVTFTSSDPAVATVTAEGRITAVAVGETTIIVSCGDINVECAVVVTDSSATTQTTVAETTEATEPVTGDWKLNREDISFTKAGDSWNLFKGSIPAEVITWTTEDAAVATVENGVVTAVGPGITNVHGELDGTKFTCIIRCRFKAVSDSESTDPAEDTEDTTATETTASTQTQAKYILCIDGQDVNKRAFGNDVTIKVGERFELTLRTENGDIIAISWEASNQGICTVNGNTVIGSKSGRTEIFINYEGNTYTCIVNVQK